MGRPHACSLLKRDFPQLSIDFFLSEEFFSMGFMPRWSYFIKLFIFTYYPLLHLKWAFGVNNFCGLYRFHNPFSVHGKLEPKGCFKLERSYAF